MVSDYYQWPYYHDLFTFLKPNDLDMSINIHIRGFKKPFVQT